MVREAFADALEPPLIPARVALRTEKVGPHVVVHAVDFPAQRVEMLRDFRTYESAGTGDEKFYDCT